MSMKEKYIPSGELQGDDRAMPDRGTSRGFTGVKPATDGRDTGPDATNRIGGFKGTSDAPDTCMPKPAQKGRA